MASKPKKPYWEMNLQELQEATAEFDKEFIADTFRPLTPRMRALWEKAKRRKPTGSKDGAVIEAVSVTVERKLLERADRLAKKKGLTRSELIARGLRAVLNGRQPRKSARVRVKS